MKRARWYVAAAMLALGVTAGATSCSSSKGQVLFVFQTDMSLPKDISAIKLLVTLEGQVIFEDTYERLGEEGSIKLPATLGFLTPDDPSQALQLQVIGTLGGDEGVKVLREVVTTVPENRTAMMHVPIHFLCYGMAHAERDEAGALTVKSNCEEGKTCVAGSCVDAEVPSADLPDYVPAEVFGGGTGNGDGACFDTLGCFDAGVSAALDLSRFAIDPASCEATAPPGLSEMNVALMTQGGGICGARGCFVPLDAASDAGWRTVEEGRIRLPPTVCARAAEGTLLGVTIAPAGSGACRQKATDRPTCGPWAASGTNYTQPSGAQPLPIALGLVHPVTMVVTERGVYWIEAGTLDAAGASAGDGAIKGVPLTGGEPQAIAKDLIAPADLAVDDAAGLVFFTTGSAQADGGALLAASLTQPLVTPVLQGRRFPQGIARRSGSLLWAELWGNQVLEIATTLADDRITAQGEPVLLTGSEPLGEFPYRLAAAEDVACWIYQGMLGDGNGAVACQRRGEPAQLVDTAQNTPHAIALDVGDSGSRAVYWANIDGGTITRVRFDGDGFGAPEVIAEGQTLPTGVAVDGEHVYWTNRGDRTVMRAPKDGGAPEILARDQNRPGTIAVTSDAIYWLNVGSSDPEPGTPSRDGAVMKLLK